jgi:hypothetical protein
MPPIRQPAGTSSAKGHARSSSGHRNRRLPVNRRPRSLQLKTSGQSQATVQAAGTAHALSVPGGTTAPGVGRRAAAVAVSLPQRRQRGRERHVAGAAGGDHGLPVLCRHRGGAQRHADSLGGRGSARCRAAAGHLGPRLRGERGAAVAATGRLHPARDHVTPATGCCCIRMLLLQAVPARSCDRKNRSISAEASGPAGSVYEPLALPPAHAWPAPCSTHCSTATRSPASV